MPNSQKSKWFLVLACTLSVCCAFLKKSQKQMFPFNSCGPPFFDPFRTTPIEQLWSIPRKSLNAQKDGDVVEKELKSVCLIFCQEHVA